MKQESKTNDQTINRVQNSTETNQSTVNVVLSNKTQPTKSNQVYVQQNLVNWKWIVIDKFKFKDVPIPCIIRNGDSINEYVSVRIVEKVILSKFEPCLSEEAKKFGVLTTFVCTPDEILTLNDINENHVDRLYGKEKFLINSDALVSLEEFLKFFEILQRTVRLKNASNENNSNKLNHSVPNNNQYLHQQRPNFQNFRMINPGIATNAYHHFLSNFSNNLNQRLVQRLPNFSQYNNNNKNNTIYANNCNIYGNPNANVNVSDNSNPNYFINYSQANISRPTMINNFQSNQINQMQHKVVNVLPAPRPTVPIIPVTSINQMNYFRNSNQNLLMDNLANNQVQRNFHPHNDSSITVTMPNTSNNMRNLTPPLTPLANMITNLASDQNDPINSIDSVESKEQAKKIDNNNPVDTSTEIFLIDDELSSTTKKLQIENENDPEYFIDSNDETYGFLQINDKILLYVNVHDSFYRYNRCLPKCNKHVLLVHLMKNFEINCEIDLKKNLKVKIIENNARIRNLIKWFNKNHAPMNLDLITDNKIELVNVMQFQNVYAKEAIFFKNLYYFNEPGIDYYAEYEKILSMQGGLVCVPIENRRNIGPFVRLTNQLLVSSNFAQIIRKSRNLNESQKENEKVNFDLRKDSKLIEEINEFFRLQIFYFSLEIKKDLFTKKSTLFFRINKWLDMLPSNFKILCEFNSSFPKTWLNDLDKMDIQNKQNDNTQSLSLSSTKSVKTNIFEKTNHVPSDTDENSQNSVFMSPQSDDQPVETISLAILNKKHSIGFTHDDFKNKPRLRSYSETSVLLKFSNKFQKIKEKQLIKYKYLFKKRNSCTALDFLNNDVTIQKEDLVKNQVLSYMDKILKKKDIEKSLISSRKKVQNECLNRIKEIKEEKTEHTQTKLGVQPFTSNYLQSTSKEIYEENNVEVTFPIATIESIKNEISTKKKSKNLLDHCPFLIDSPNKTNDKNKMKRKKSKIVDKFRKRARLSFEDKELKKDLNFIVPDDRIMILKENEHFNFLPKKIVEPKNLSAIKQNQNDLYSTDSFDEKLHIKNFNICVNAKVVVDRIDVKKYLNKFNQSSLVKKEKIDKLKNTSKKSLSPETNILSQNLANSITNEYRQKKTSINKFLRIESDDELPRLDLDLSKP